MPSISFLSNMDPIRHRSVKYFELKKVRINEESGADIARRFGIHYGSSFAPVGFRHRASRRNVIVEKDEFGIVFRKGHLQVSIARASGAIDYRNLNTFAKDLRRNADFSDEEAVRLAKEHARSLDLIPLRECKLLKVSRLNMGMADLSSRAVTSRVVNVAVVFQRLVGRIPVEGPGGKLAVFLDARGDLCGVNRVWRDFRGEVRPASPVEHEELVTELRPTTFARDTFTSHFEDRSDSPIRVIKELFGYWEMGPRDAQQFLQPVFVMHYEIEGPGGSSRKGIDVIPAGRRRIPGLEFIRNNAEVQPRRRS